MAKTWERSSAAAHSTVSSKSNLELSRWFIKDSSIDQQIQACRKSLEKAKASGRESITKSLQAKLDKLLGTAGAAQGREVVSRSNARIGACESKPTNGVPSDAKAVKRKKKVVNTVRRPKSVAAVDRKTSATSAVAEKTTAGAAKTAGVKAKRRKGTTDRETAENLLLRAVAASKARGDPGSDDEDVGAIEATEDWENDPELAALLTEGRQSAHLDDEGSPLDAMDDDDEPEASDEGRDDDAGNDSKESDFFEEASVDDDAFEAVETIAAYEPLPPRKRKRQTRELAAVGTSLFGVGAVPVDETVGSLQESARPRSTQSLKRLRRKERLKQIAAFWAAPHPTMVAAKRSKVSGSIVKGAGKLTRFPSDSDS
eukprot:TRINITY_DN67458_c0_g1_i1.p1 TRINITY_DN67458_c0_g1~~TRINITY_DN67458_c0_g1_i1.p1  ORF type:complete len:395 (+),score=83.77 TRINITY_DN67458_c0_g1_i1:74-1186(+)